MAYAAGITSQALMLISFDVSKIHSLMFAMLFILQMMGNLLLTEGQPVTFANVSLPKGTYVKLQPVTSGDKQQQKSSTAAYQHPAAANA